MSRSRYLLILGFTLAVSLASLVTLAPLVNAQDIATPSGEADSGSRPSLTLDDIQARIDVVNADTSLADDLKATIVGQYTQATDHLKAAQEWAERTAKFRAIQDDPDFIADLKAALRATQDAPSPEIDPEASAKDLESRLNEQTLELDKSRENLSSLEKEMGGRTAGRGPLRERLAAVRAQLSDLGTSSTTAGDPDEAPQLTQARKVGTEALRIALDAEVQASCREKKVLWQHPEPGADVDRRSQ